MTSERISAGDHSALALVSVICAASSRCGCGRNERVNGLQEPDDLSDPPLSATGGRDTALVEPVCNGLQGHKCRPPVALR